MMKKILSSVLALAMMFSFVLSLTAVLSVSTLFSASTAYASGTVYYVSSSSGSDSNNGTSPSTPWKTLANVGSKSYMPGDQILLKSGDSWNEQLSISNSSGTAANPILLSSYGSGNKPKINRNMQPLDKCIVFTNVGGWKVTNLDIGNAGVGITFFYDDSYGHDYIWVENVYFHDIYGIDQLHPPASGIFYQYSSAIAIGGDVKTAGRADYTMIQNITITNCISNGGGALLGSVGQVLVSPEPANVYWMKKNVVITNSVSNNNAIYGIVIAEVDGGYMDNCTFLFNGQQQITVGSAAIMIGNIKNYTVKNSEFAYQQRQGTDPDGDGIDFELRCYDVTFLNNYIHHNAAVGALFYGNSGFVSNRVVLDGNRFQYNNQNGGNPSGYEIYFYTPNGNDNGSIINNEYYAMAGIGFVNAHSSTVSMSNNKNYYSAWEFNAPGNLEGWTAQNNISGFAQSGTAVNGTITGPDPYIVSSIGVNTPISSNKTITIRMKNTSSSNVGQIYFTTTTDGVWNDAKSISFGLTVNDPNYTVYTIDMSSVPGWTGTLSQLRIDPEQGASSGSFSIDYIRIGSYYA
ncbi:right-handed parallel beta-helix repeat-containing protein [Cohnella silvisoli]|uniref:Right-handed parallel beta-helix repeat-containing protein n=1 Tax=Cohnella silvisoli TaxID=2873699 RepID=A0ABV1KLK1_9BACL|nr:right-handed parallel beta-helix repeat-containing protein [Cohnella silvisoli]MCD9020673.1 right-handed parallel beta-helix repeat-containing protein [Cohnella silvisoli]